jgi:uncharacterized protein YjbJ (UPF0337 family)
MRKMVRVVTVQDAATFPSQFGVRCMNQDIIQGKWTQLRGSLKNKFGKLTDDDLSRIEGNREYLAGKLQERYGWQKDQVDRELNAFEKTLHQKAA